MATESAGFSTGNRAVRFPIRAAGPRCTVTRYRSVTRAWTWTTRSASTAGTTNAALSPKISTRADSSLRPSHATSSASRPSSWAIGCSSGEAASGSSTSTNRKRDTARLSRACATGPRVKVPSGMDIIDTIIVPRRRSPGAMPPSLYRWGTVATVVTRSPVIAPPNR